MSDQRPSPARRGLSTDATLGAVGGCLAVASATFGIAMTVHGPVGGLGTSGNFTVFAQMVGRKSAPDEDVGGRGGTAAARPSFAADELDRTATASIPAEGRLRTVVLQSAGSDEATILVDGRSRTVRVGDIVPGAGEVLAITGGSRPMLRTSLGVLAAAASPAPR